MSLTWSRIIVGVQLVSGLDTFPVFIGYMLMILLAGQWKKFTSPLNLRPVLVVYNLTASVISLYTLYGFCYGIYLSDSSFETKPSNILRPVFRVYWLVKNLELLDTVFMVLRHKINQISFLHVFHHGSMLILSDLAYHFYPYPGIAPYLGLNSAVHVVLYFYYGLCALYPENPPQWKKRLTQFQIIQFFIDFIHATVGYLYYNYCIYSLSYGVAMTALFINFYHQAYIRKQLRKPKGETNVIEANISNDKATEAPNGYIPVGNGKRK